MQPFTVSGEVASAIVLDSPHSGTHYPDDFRYALPLEILRTAEDTHVEKLYSFSSAMGVPLLEANFPRSYLDANRSLSEVDHELFLGDWTAEFEVSPKARLGKGLIWRMMDDGALIYEHPLQKSDYDYRVNTYWRPYHAEMARLLTTAHERFGKSLHLNCHSMPSLAAKYGTNFPGLKHPDVVLGDLDGTTAHPAITEFLREQFVSLGYTCWVNKPYKGVELIRAYARPDEQKHAVQVELNRSLYMNETTLEVHDGFTHLQADLERVLEAAQVFMEGL